MLHGSLRPCVFAAALALAASTQAHATDARELSGKTIVYTSSGYPGQIYVAPSGNVYWSYQPVLQGRAMGRGSGYEYKLGRTITKPYPGGCKVQSTARYGAGTLTLDATAFCPSQQSRDTQHLVVTISGSGCRLSQYSAFSHPSLGNTSSRSAAETCAIVSGNHMPR